MMMDTVTIADEVPIAGHRTTDRWFYSRTAAEALYRTVM
jgi:hypothetical protein